MYCQNCGKEVNDKAVVCIHCGVATGKGDSLISSKDAPSNKKTEEGLSLLALGFGYGSAFVFPPGGIIMGICALKKDKAHGTGMICISIFFLIFLMGAAS